MKVGSFVYQVPFFRCCVKGRTYLLGINLTIFLSFFFFFFLFEKEEICSCVLVFEFVQFFSMCMGPKLEVMTQKVFSLSKFLTGYYRYLKCLYVNRISEWWLNPKVIALQNFFHASNGGFCSYLDIGSIFCFNCVLLDK